MGFNKRFVKIENVIQSIKNDFPLSKVFAADALIFTDDDSIKVFKLHQKGVSDEEILNIIQDGKLNEFTPVTL
jgi:hypothetical protein